MSEGSATASDHGRRNRLIAIAAGAITVVAIVLGFAGDVLGLPWHWMRPAAELLLLAELVGLVVLERHQLFEPVSEKVDDVQSRVGTVQTRVDEIHAMMTENVRSSGQVTPCASVTDVARRGAQALREALARDQQAPQILRMARLGGLLVRGANVEEDQGPAAELQELLDALKAYSVTLDTPPDARSRRWSVRVIFAVATSRSFDLYLQQNMRSLYAGKPSNVEYKALVRSRIEPTLSPAVVTDRDIVAVFDDAAGSFGGAWFQGPQYLALFQRWFDELWASIPEDHLVLTRNGFNQSAIDRIRKELEAVESAQTAGRA